MIRNSKFLKKYCFILTILLLSNFINGQPKEEVKTISINHVDGNVNGGLYYGCRIYVRSLGDESILRTNSRISFSKDIKKNKGIIYPINSFLAFYKTKKQNYFSLVTTDYLEVVVANTQIAGINNIIIEEEANFFGNYSATKLSTMLGKTPFAYILHKIESKVEVLKVDSLLDKSIIRDSVVIVHNTVLNKMDVIKEFELARVKLLMTQNKEEEKIYGKRYFKYGYLNTSGKWVIQPNYLKLSLFNSYGIAYGVKDYGAYELYRWFNNKGEVILEDSTFKSNIDTINQIKSYSCYNRFVSGEVEELKNGYFLFSQANALQKLISPKGIVLLTCKNYDRYIEIIPNSKDRVLKVVDRIAKTTTIFFLLDNFSIKKIYTFGKKDRCYVRISESDTLQITINGNVGGVPDCKFFPLPEVKNEHF